MAQSVADVKPAGYYGVGREDLVAKLPRPLGRVLDVGCGEGAVSQVLRDAGATEVAGVEIMPAAAAIARGVVDHLYEGSVEDALASGDLPGPFDTIVAYDVLEHLVDPEAVLAALRTLAAPGARLHVSVPNARNFTLVRDLVLRGTFGYTDFGHRDTTHLRWFTRADIIESIGRTGWSVQSWAPNAFRGRDAPVDRLSRGHLREFIALQWNVLAVAPGS